MARLPQPGGDNGTWGDILNEYLSQSLKPDGTIKDNAVTPGTIAPNAVNAVAIQNGSIAEALLDTNVQTKLNAIGNPDWNNLTNKPAVIAAGATAAAAKAPLSLAKADVGLGNVDNTSDATKNSALATLTNKTISGASNTLSNIPESAITGLTSDLAGKEPTISGGTTGQYWRGDKSWQSLDKAAVGLNNANNTSDLNKPISTATQTALDAKADLVGGVLPTSQLPTLALTDVVTVADQAAMLALTPSQVQPGDVAVRTDGAGSYILTDTDPSILSNWTLLDSPADAVTSVNGQQGTVVLGAADIGLNNVDNTSDLNKPISIATQAALDDKADLVGGTIPSSQLPSLSLTTAVTVASQAAMLALTTSQVQPGDLAIRTDGAGTFILTATDPSVLSNWKLLNSPTDTVTSVNSQTGTVVLSKSDVGLSNVDNTSDATKNSAVATLTNKTLTDPKIDKIFDTVNNVQIAKFIPGDGPASNMNIEFYARQSASDNAPIIRAAGAGSNIGLDLYPKGTGPVGIYVDAGQTPTILAKGSDTNLDINLTPKGTGKVKANSVEVATISDTQTLSNKTLTIAKIGTILDTTNGQPVAAFAGENNVQNSLTFQSKNTGSYPQIYTSSNDTDSGVTFVPKGAGTIQIYAATGKTPTIAAVGADTNHDLNLVSKGTGAVKANGTQVADISSAQTLTNKTLSTATVITGLPTGSGVASAATASTLAARDANANLTANAYSSGFTTTATAAGITTLTIASTGIQVFTGTTTQTVKLPTTSVVAGARYIIANQSTGKVTVQSSGANTITYLTTNGSAIFTALVAAPTGTSDWKMQYMGPPRIDSTASSATPTINTDLSDEFDISALATNITSMTTNLSGSPVNGQKMIIRIKDDGNARTIAWGASFTAISNAPLLTSTVAGKTHYTGFIYDSTAAKWVCVAVDPGGY